ncbi:MAG TPA: helix-turn-helix domain-containing protein [Actinospica sp.]|jgi:DNA-binding transcriptional ArsR family regulator|nr:helix-turn-helix domain-containing protein [Actinospica sp.]
MASSGEGSTDSTGSTEHTDNAREAGVEGALSLGPQPLPELIEYRKVEDAATMKALADPLRLRIMRVLGKGAAVEPRVMTVKQLAEELGEPTTKLYRHIKQLLAVDMIQVAELRLVGGIVEQHYRVAQAGWAVHPGVPEVPREQLLSEEMFGVADAAITEFLTRYESALRAGRTFLREEDSLENPPHVRSVGIIGDCRIPRDRAVDFADRLHELVKEFSDTKSSTEPDGVTANLMVMFYATQPDADG